MNKTFTFLQRISSPPHSLSKNSLPPAIIRRMSSNLMKAPLQELTPAASQNTPPDSLLESIFTKILTQSPSTPPTPSRLHLPGYYPPLLPPAGLQDGVGQGRPPIWASSCPPTSCTSVCPPSPLPSRSSCS